LSSDTIEGVAKVRAQVPEAQLLLAGRIAIILLTIDWRYRLWRSAI
jgi:hypothetical protein